MEDELKYSMSAEICSINCHPDNSDKDNTGLSFSDSKDWLYWISDFDNQHNTEDNCGAEIESDIGPNNRIEEPECPKETDVSPA